MKMLEEGFPKELSSDVHFVCQKVANRIHKHISITQNQTSTWQLLDNQLVTFPYRIYNLEDIIEIENDLTPTQQIIYHCIFSRSDNGYIREAHIKELLTFDLPIWALPYIIQICDEYIVEILELVYIHFQDNDQINLQKICQKNIKQFLRGYHRMISYWNEYYRQDCFQYKQYIGYLLYSECFGYQQSMNKLYYTRG